MGKEIGIDFGTTNTVVSYVNKRGKLRSLRSGNKEVIPSAIYFKSKDEYIIGENAKRSMKLNHNKAGIINFKPKIGEKTKYDVIAENGDEFSIRPREVARLFLNKVIHAINEKLIKEFGPIEGCIDRAVITVPAKFSSTEKKEIRKAAQSANLKIVKLAAEPTAAAIAYQNDLGDEAAQNEAILVYDFGGGTFDVSIIRKERGSFHEIATGGDKTLGGNKLTASMEEELLSRINDKYGMELPFDEDEFDEDYYEMSLEDYHKNMMEIYDKANLMKEELSEEETVTCLCNIILPGRKTAVYEAEFSRDELEDYIKDDIATTVDITVQTIKEAEDKGINEINQIVLAGGSSNIPLVKEMLEDSLRENKVVYSDDVSTLISRGAAVMAKNLQDINNMTEQITNVQLGVAATEGVQYGKFQIIIPENEPLPCSRTRKFNLVQDGQRRLDVIYYERDIKNYPNAVRIDDEGIDAIDTLIIDNLPAGLKKDDAVIEVNFTAQKDGSLDIDVDIKDLKGNSIQHGDLSIAKESDLE
ncbi:Hsp70 family protein [Megamonas hypermegale]|uniref:Hsp70 family protein n=1 Tax=Megamonas hypermegale TaxID=158847 RepID=UPI0026EE322C|nr:Hsp70 family protein [Megamonas hypermegale]